MLLLFSHLVMSDSLWPHGLQHTRPPCSSQSPKFAEVHVNGISDAIQPSRPLMPSSPSALNLSHNQDFFNELAVRNRWPKYWSFSFSISPSTEHSKLISLKIDWFGFRAIQGTSPQFEGINSLVFCLPYGPALNHMWPLGRPHPWLYAPLLAEWCLCFSTHSLGLSSLSCQEAIVLWFHGCSHYFGIISRIACFP